MKVLAQWVIKLRPQIQCSYDAGDAKQIVGIERYFTTIPALSHWSPPREDSQGLNRPNSSEAAAGSLHGLYKELSPASRCVT
jgi:hypothetical protein